MDIKIARVSFAGNMEKLYDFYIHKDAGEVGGYVICDTIRGPSLGKIVSFTTFQHRSKECCRWIIWCFSASALDADIHKIQWRKRIRQAEIEEMLE